MIPEFDYNLARASVYISQPVLALVSHSTLDTLESVVQQLIHPVQMATFCGGIVGSFVYDSFLFVGSESFVNRPNASARAHHERAHRSARDKIPAGVDVV